MVVVGSWLTEFLGIKLSNKQVVDAMESGGIEIESIKNIPKYDNKIIVAEILSIKKHPNAEKLSIAKVGYKKQKTNIVSAAQNLEKGQKVALALGGAKLPSGQRISEAKFRGVASDGMLLSEKELGLGDNHDGILVLDSSLVAGTSLNKVLKEDTLFDVTLPANRPDLQSIIGVAREISAQAGTKLNFNSTLAEIDSRPASKFKNELKELVPRYILAKVSIPDSSKKIETPISMRQRLTLAGIKPTNLIVDVTNYVMLEIAQPLHAFDADKITGNIKIRRGKNAELLTTLDGKQRKLSPTDIVIADSRKAIALAGIMGGKNSEVDERSKNVIIESATFNAFTVRKSALTHGARTEASTRFEKNLPVQFAQAGIKRTLDILSEIANAKVEWIEDELNVWPWVQHIGVRPSRLSQLAGINISEKQVVDSLKKLGFEAEPFDIAKEAKKHLGKPYIWGASYKTHKDTAFDCSYLVDYIYSLIGVNAGHSAFDQWKKGKEIAVKDLHPGDVLFRGGPWHKLKETERGGVSHTCIYIGNSKIIEAKDYERSGNKWKKLPTSRSQVVSGDLESITKDPDFLGARRFVDDLSDFVAVTVPWWRPDVITTEDIFEEIIKLTRLHNVPKTLPKWNLENIKFDKKPLFYWKVRELLAAFGLSEVVTYPFISEAEINNLKLKISEHLRIINPRSQEQNYLRTHLAQSLLLALSANTRKERKFGLFEISRVYKNVGKNSLPKEVEKMGVIVQSPGDVYNYAKEILDYMLSALDIDVEISQASAAFSHPGLSASVKLNNKIIGHIAEFDPIKLRPYKINGRAAYIEVEVAQLHHAYTPARYRKIYKYQPITRDLTFVLANDVMWYEVKKALNSAGIDAISYLGQYKEENTKSSKKAISFRFRFEKEDGPPSPLDVKPYLDKIINVLNRRFGAQIKD